jgi:antitoxin VapB
MTSSKVFASNLGQAVLLPEVVAFPRMCTFVDVLKVSQGRVIVPQGHRWHDLFQNGPRASEDFMLKRNLA